MCTNVRRLIHECTYIKMHMLVLLKKCSGVTQTWKSSVSMSVKLLLSAVQRDFEMEISLRRIELGAVERCETDDAISSGRFPHACCLVLQISLSTFPPPNFRYLHTGANTYTHTDLY